MKFEDLGKLMTYCMVTNGLTVNKLTEMSGLNFRTVSAAISGTAPKLEVYNRLAEIMNAKIGYTLEDK